MKRIPAAGIVGVVALREAAVRKGLHVSEYGILDDSTGVTHRCATEEEVYALLGMAWIPPELREDRGELEAAARGELPVLLEVNVAGEASKFGYSPAQVLADLDGADAIGLAPIAEAIQLRRGLPGA